MYDRQRYLDTRPLPSVLKWSSALSIENRLFLIGGVADGNVTNQVLELDLSTNSWVQLANMPTARSAMGLVYHQGKIWAIGGYSTSHSNAVESYDPVTDTWSVETSLLTPRHGHRSGRWMAISMWAEAHRAPLRNPPNFMT